MEGGFCFKRFLRGGGSQYFRPSRAGYGDDRSCENGPSSPARRRDWARHGARWMSPACHRSLYSYQVRTTLALAIEQPHLAVTLRSARLHRATIGAGMFASQRADDCPWVVGIETCSGTSPAQFAELKDVMAAVHRQSPNRNLDHDAADGRRQRREFRRARRQCHRRRDDRTAPAQARRLHRRASPTRKRPSTAICPDEFSQLRTALKPYVGGNLDRVVFVSYGNPAMQAEDKPCPGGRDGLDVHPAFGADGERLRAAAEFVDNKFLPKIKALATCDGNKICRDPSTERMTFVDGHQAAFDRHGMCVRAPSDPEFDRNCFSTNGDSFPDRSDRRPRRSDGLRRAGRATIGPMRRAARWIRTANDSYFTAMTYPEGMPAILKPSDIHDALWGVLSAVYGGAVHPTAEGYAAMADAALPAVRGVLGLTAPPAVQAEPLPPPTAPAPRQPCPPAPTP